MVQILFTPFADNQRTIDGTGGIPDLTLRRDDVVAFWRGPSLADHITRAE